MKPLANKAILDEALRFQGTLSWTQSSWGEGSSSSSTLFLGIERGEGFSELGREVLEILVDAVKKPLSMAFQDG